MRSLPRFWLTLLALSSLGLALTNCTNPYGSSGGGGGGVVPTPSPSPTTTPTPGPCGTPDSTNPNLVVVSMALAISATTPPGYPTVSGYGVSDSNYDIPTQSGLINVTAFGGTVPITTQNTIQFFNAEASSTVHSAYGFKGDSFPALPYAFPSPVPSPTATTIAAGVSWFTGRVPAQDATGSVCFSPEFKLTKGVYYFGDYDYYNPSNIRGILVVGTPTPAADFKGRAPYRRASVRSKPPVQ